MVIDMTNGGWPQDRQLLLDTMRQYSSKWRIFSDIPEDATHHHLLIYRRVGAGLNQYPKNVRIRMRFTLGRDFSLQR